MALKEKYVRKKFLQNLGLILGSILLLLILFEATLQLVSLQDQDNYKKFPQGLFCQRHSLLGWMGIPNISGKCSFNADDMETMDIAMNAEGFWDDQHAVPKEKTKKRILFLGDSFTIGYGVRKEFRFSDLVKAKLSSGYEVINMGVWGYSTDQELLLLKEKGIKYDPDIVVLSVFLDDLFCTNLFSVNDGMYLKPKFLVSQNNSLELTNVPVQNNHCKSLFINMLITRLNKLRNRLAVGNDFANRGWLSVFDTNYLKENKFLLPLRLLKEMHLILKERKIKFLVVLIPYVDQLFDKEIYSSTNKYAGIPRKRLSLRLPQKVINFFCKKEGIQIIDLLPKFKRRINEDKFFFEEDLHWTKAGHSLAADEIISKLKCLGYI